MALESLPKIAPALFSAEQDLIQIYNKKSDTFGTINASLLGGSTPPSGVSGAIQFSTGSAFGSDSANLFWDNVNKRLGVNTNAPNFPVDVVGEIRSTTQVSAGASGINGVFAVRRTSDGNVIGTFAANANEVVITEFTGQGGRLDTGYATTALKWIGTGSQPRVGIGFNGSVLATTHIKGSGSTSATTSLLVQNSAGTESMTFTDDGVLTVANPSNTGSPKIRVGTSGFNNDFNQLRMYAAGNLALAIQSNSIAFTGSGAYAQMSWVTNTSLSLSTNDSQVFMNAQGTSFGKGSGAATSSIVEIASTTKGFLPPRMTTAQRNAIASPANSLIVFDTDLQNICYRRDGVWVQVSYTAA